MRTDETAAAVERDLPIVRDLSPPAADPGPPGLVILYGLPGSGKTYFSRLVAERASRRRLEQRLHQTRHHQRPAPLRRP